MLSQRQYRLQRLILAANAQTSVWLIGNIRDYRPERDVSRLSLIACLRILCGRDRESGAVYRDARRAIIKRIRGNVNSPSA